MGSYRRIQLQPETRHSSLWDAKQLLMMSFAFCSKEKGDLLSAARRKENCFLQQGEKITDDDEWCRHPFNLVM
jgi:hypothetical protein